jgi:gliding motility-associated-like protein
MKQVLTILSILIGLNAYNQVYIPNSFTPNNDGINDYISFHTSDTLDIFEFTLFDKWGNIVWYTTDPNDKWDGGDEYYLIDGIYIYVMKYIVSRTKTYEIKRGNILLVR